MDDMQKYKVISLLDAQVDAKSVADELGISYGVVLKLKREYETAIVEGTLDKLINTDVIALQRLAEELPDDKDYIQAAASKLVTEVSSIQRLQSNMTKTAEHINTRVLSLTMSADVGELKTLTEILCNLQVAFFNKNSTQVNVQNNFGNGVPKYSQFLGDKPGD
jgi:hypothetical protein